MPTLPRASRVSTAERTISNHQLKELPVGRQGLEVWRKAYGPIPRGIFQHFQSSELHKPLRVFEWLRCRHLCPSRFSIADAQRPIKPRETRCSDQEEVAPCSWD